MEKTLWEEKKVLVTSIYSFYPQCFQEASFVMHNEFWYCVVQDYPFPKRHISDSSKLKEFADDNYKFDENG